MISKDIAKGLLAVLGGMILFKSVTYLPTVEGFFQAHPYVMLVVGFGIFYFRDAIVTKLGAK